MKRRAVWFASLLVLAGCGGGGDGIVDFQGTFVGGWTSASGQAGTATLSFDSNRSFTGTFSQEGQGDAVISGTVGTDGTASGTIVANGQTFSLSGRWRLDRNGNLTGTFTQTVDGVQTTVTFVLHRRTTPV